MRYARDRLELRGQFAHVTISNAAELNDALGRAVGVDPNIASALRGFYGEAGYRVVSGARIGDVGVFARYENFDTQFRMPDGYVPLEEFDRDALRSSEPRTGPIPTSPSRSTIRSCETRARSITAPNSFNIGLGWWF